MRTLFLNRAYTIVRGQTLIRIAPAGRRSLHWNLPRHQERNAEPPELSPTPRKRGRPRKMPAQVEEGQLVDETSIANLRPHHTPSKPRKAPKIHDISRLIPLGSPASSPPRPLRPYQQECIDACLNAISQGKRRLGISLATGAGKTVIFTNLIGKLQLEDSKRYQTIILVHRRELVEQAARHCVEAYPDKVMSRYDAPKLDC